jgi:hypothetical protein
MLFYRPLRLSRGSDGGLYQPGQLAKSLDSSGFSMESSVLSTKSVDCCLSEELSRRSDADQLSVSSSSSMGGGGGASSLSPRERFLPLDPDRPGNYLPMTRGSGPTPVKVSVSVNLLKFCYDFHIFEVSSQIANIFWNTCNVRMREKKMK